MTKRLFFIILLIFTFNKVKAQDTNNALDFNDSLVVLAPKNMSYALTEIFRAYSTKYNRKITGSFNNLNILMKDILEGKQANIIITDHTDWITSFKQKGLINISSITNLVEDRLALVTSKEFYNFNSHKLAELTDYQAKANFYQNFTLFLPKWTDDMAGMYAHEALKNMKYLFNSKNKIIEILNPADELSKINDSIAIIRYSESYDNPNINIIEVIDAQYHRRFIYQIAIIAGENMEEARNFLEFITNDEILKIFTKHGFQNI
ncbi:MAG: molybdate ABC transporter substrate-binding protein [Rickettsiales bacterium]